MEFENQFDVAGPNDGFGLALRRQGWHLTGYKPVYADPNVIRPQPYGPWGDQTVAAAMFYVGFGNNTVRKLLRAAFTSTRSHQELERICGKAEKLDATLTFLEWSRILTREGEAWTKGPACEGVDNTGPTLEWYVAEWFRHELQAPARHGVTLEEVPRGGDLDVVAFVNDTRMFVECKTGKPESISETDIRWFLQRAHDFNPEVAVLLVDTESTVAGPVSLVAQIMAELNWLENHPEATSKSDVPAEVRQNAGVAQVPYGYTELYCCGANIFVTGVPDSIDKSLSAVLRLYHSYVRHQLILPVPLEWDFVNGKVHRSTEQPFGVNGQVRVTLPD